MWGAGLTRARPYAEIRALKIDLAFMNHGRGFANGMIRQTEVRQAWQDTSEFSNKAEIGWTLITPFHLLLCII